MEKEKLIVTLITIGLFGTFTNILLGSIGFAFDLKIISPKFVMIGFISSSIIIYSAFFIDFLLED